MFHRWLEAEEVEDLDSLCNLMIVEQFKNILHESVAIYVSEDKVKTVSEASSLADGYFLTHKNNFREFSPRKDYYQREQCSDLVNTVPRFNAGPTVRYNTASGGKGNDGKLDNMCHKCHKPGHWRGQCPEWYRNRPREGMVSTKDVGCVSSVRFAGVRNAQNVDGINAFSSKCSISGENENLNVVPTTIPDADYTPFVSDGYVSLVGDSRRVPVRILRDTGASESFIRQSVLPFSSASDTDSVVLIQGIGLHSFPVPLHRIELNSGFVNSEVIIAVRPSLPVDGIDLIMGNNLGHDCVFPFQSLPPPVVSTGVLLSPESDKCFEDFQEGVHCLRGDSCYGSCAGRETARRFWDVV